MAENQRENQLGFSGWWILVTNIMTNIAVYLVFVVVLGELFFRSEPPCRIKIRLGVKVQTDPELYHNRPDILLITMNPDNVFIIEIAVAHLQKIKL